MGDLFEDLRDGHNLISLLEVLSGEHLVSSVLFVADFLIFKKIARLCLGVAKYSRGAESDSRRC